MGEGGATAEKPTAKGPDPLIGRVINDRFRIVATLARGGMGKVYRAEQAPLGREIALKVLNPKYSGENDPEFHKRFFLEASTCSKLSHPNTVTIFDYGRTDDDVYYIAMELLEGRTLHRTLREDGALSAERAMHIARQVCRSLREAHGLGVIHRDLKPANIFLVQHGDESDFVKVLDFGLVKDLEDTGEDLTQTGLFMGSPKYMSPEQIRGEKVDGRADIYALGVILYEMLTGRVPFDRANSVNILMAHVHEAPPPLLVTNPDADVPPALEQIVARAMAKQPDDRFASMDELLAALKGTAGEAGLSVTHSGDLAITGEHAAETGQHTTVTITGTPTGTPLSETAAEGADAAPKRRGVGIAVGVAVVLGLAATGGAFVLTREDAAPAAPAPRPSEPEAAASPDEPVDTAAPEPEPQPVPTAMVSLRSTPPGATVLVGEQEYGPTPADIEWRGEDAERGRQVNFVFQLDGYRDYSVTRVLTSDRIEVEATLEAIRRAPRRPASTRRRPPPRRREPTRPVEGYKLDPY